MTERTPSPHKSAQNTAKWAGIMTKWWITRYSNKQRARWQILGFGGPNGGESRGVVDLMAIRKDHRSAPPSGLKRGDLFEVVLIQVKGGSARRPTGDDERRLRRIAERYQASHIVLAEWTRGQSFQFLTSEDDGWKEASPHELFG